MAMSYSYKLQAAVYDAWQAAEAKLAQPIALLPNFEVHDAVVADQHDKTLEEAAKLLGISRNKFCAWLRKGSYTRYNNVPYQHSITAGWLASAFTSQFVTPSGIMCPPKTFVTGKGMSYFFGKLSSQRMLP